MNEEQIMLRDALMARLASHDIESGWAELGNAGVRGLCVPENLGGLGLALTEAEPVMQALGELCLPSSFLETSIIATKLLASAHCSGSDDVLRAIAMNGERVAIAGLDPRLRGDLSADRVGEIWTLSGTARVVLDADTASSFIVIASHEEAPGIFLLQNAQNIERRSFPTIDGRTAADLIFRQTPATLIKMHAETLIAEVTDDALACLAIEAAALMERLVKDTVEYAKQREQFGQSIAKFQVVQHRLVDMNIQARRAGAIARRAMTVLGGSVTNRARTISAAKVTIAQAGRFVGQQAVQLHGGMGMSVELSIGRYFKRLTVIENELGSVDNHLYRYATASVA